MNLVDAIEESKRLLGIASLKEKQEAAIMSFLGGRDTVVSLPTGYGNSLIYALLRAALKSMSKKRGGQEEMAWRRRLFYLVERLDDMLHPQ